MTGRRELLSLVLSSCLAAAATQAHAYEFLPLRDLGGGAYYSEATDISGDGSIVVGNMRRSSGDAEAAFRWTREGGFQSLQGEGGLWSNATAISDDGSTIVGYGERSANQYASFRWTAAEGIVNLAEGELDPTPLAVSVDGSVIVGYDGLYEGPGYWWTQESGWIEISTPRPFFRANPVAVSADGSVVAGSTIAEEGYHLPIVWRRGSEGWEEQFIDEVQVSSSLGSPAVAVSSDGTTIVGYEALAETTDVFLYTERGVERLGNFFGEPRPGYDEYTFVYDASADVSAIVGQASPPDAGFAVIWTRGDGWRRVDDLLTEQGVDLAGWRLTSATAISADGTTIVGRGYDAQGREGAWLAVIVPEPAAWVLMVIGVAIASCAPKRNLWRESSGASRPRSSF